MKELSIEEKAKRYDEAIEVAKFLKENTDGVGATDVSVCFEHIFPELKESEDERIRKAILWCIRTVELELGCKDAEGLAMAKLKSWLEKQGEHANFRNKIQIGDKVTRNQDGVLVNLSQLKRVAKPVEPMIVGQEPLYDYTNANICQKDFAEQKPVEWDILSAKKGDMLSNGTIVLIVDSIEEFEGRPIINSWYFADSEKFYGKGTSECDRWEVGGFRTATKIECNYLLKMIADAEYEWDADRKELKKIEQKPAWSEEDDKIQNDLIWIIEAYRKNGFNKGHFETANRAENWLKSIKDRVQPKQKWNEEDEKTLNEIAHFFDSLCSSLATEERHAENRRWLKFLKSLRHQNIWKPSDEQMWALSTLANTPESASDTCKQNIQELLEQLKKLKENKL